MAPMPTSQEERRIGLAWALASAVGGGLMAIPWKLANEAGEPEHSALLLLGVAALGNSLLVVGQRVTAGSIRPKIGLTDLWVAGLLALFTLLGNLASAIAIQELSPALLNVLLRADILFVAVFGWLLLGERVERRFWLATLIALGGLFLMQGPMGEQGIGELLGSGTGMAIAAAACFSGLVLVTRRFVHRIDPTAVNAMRLWIAVALWFVFHPWPRFSQIPGEQVLHAALAAMAGPFLGRLALMLSARYIEARVTTLATLMSPLLTLVLAFVLISDWPQVHELIGGAIMMAGLSIPFLRPPRPPGGAK
ncbi:MAG: DMT family transporter [Deltaproteobacteria bacterium]|nr:DMT family transporter [Deltaproteobacteria bacterium]MBW2499833.1 DMT family transporter [Deltaproteobacteria bacterium]